MQWWWAFRQRATSLRQISLCHWSRHTEPPSCCCWHRCSGCCRPADRHRAQAAASQCNPDGTRGRIKYYNSITNTALRWGGVTLHSLVLSTAEASGRRSRGERRLIFPSALRTPWIRSAARSIYAATWGKWPRRHCCIPTSAPRLPFPIVRWSKMLALSPSVC